MKNKKNENENKESCDNLCNLVVRKRKMIKDERGQWIISAGFLVSVSIIILALLLNQAMMGGYLSSGAILEFPKHDIRELVQETHREVIIAADRANTHNITEDAVRANFTIANFTNQTLRIYATHGQMVYMNISSASFSFNATTNKIERVNVTILFSDGVTTCTFDPEVIEIPCVPEQVLGPEILYAFLYADNLTSVCNITSPENASNATDDFVATVSEVGDGDTVNATIGNYSVGSGNISSVNFEIRLRTAGTWKNDKIDISYSPDAGGNWSTVASSVKPSYSLDWYGNYPATNVTTWGEVDNMTIRITGIAQGSPDDYDLEIDAYHVYVVYQVPP